MSDDLVKKLLEPCFERGLDALWIDAQRKEAADRVEELEAKLTKAVDALALIDRMLTNLQPKIPQIARGGWGLDKVVDAYVDPALAAARTAIAELTGETK